jgi:hypothetical protein
MISNNLLGKRTCGLCCTDNIEHQPSITYPKNWPKEQNFLILNFLDHAGQSFPDGTKCGAGGEPKFCVEGVCRVRPNFKTALVSLFVDVKKFCCKFTHFFPFLNSHTSS